MPTIKTSGATAVIAGPEHAGDLRRLGTRSTRRHPMTRFSLLFLALGGLASHAAAAERTKFHVRIENVSTMTTLHSKTGATAPGPNSPGLWVVHTSKAVVFTEGQLDRGAGLEAQAEDGTPGPLAMSIAKAKGVDASGIFDTPVDDAQPGPALPGKAYEFTFQASPGDHLTVTTMFGQSNDLFYAPSDGASRCSRRAARSPATPPGDSRSGTRAPRSTRSPASA
jgi:hypothetical protein